MPSLVATFLPSRLAEDRDEASRGLVKTLRSGEGVPNDLALILADMLDPAGPGEWRLTFSKRRRGVSPKPSAVALKREAGQFLREEIDDRGKAKKIAMAEAQGRFGLKRTALDEALSQSRAEEALRTSVISGI